MVMCLFSLALRRTYYTNAGAEGVTRAIFIDVYCSNGFARTSEMVGGGVVAAHVNEE